MTTCLPLRLYIIRYCVTDRSCLGPFITVSQTELQNLNPPFNLQISEQININGHMEATSCTILAQKAI